MKVQLPLLFMGLLLSLSIFAQVNQPFSPEPEKATAQRIEDILPYFFAAARTGDTEVIDTFIAAGLPIDIKNHKGYTALIISAYNGQQAVVKYLLDKGANACTEDNRGNTALMGAIFKGELKIAKQLLAADCATDHQNNAGQTALMMATLFEKQALKALLVDHGADPRLNDYAGNSAESIKAFNTQAN